MMSIIGRYIIMHLFQWICISLSYIIIGIYRSNNDKNYRSEHITCTKTILEMCIKHLSAEIKFRYEAIILVIGVQKCTRYKAIKIKYRRIMLNRTLRRKYFVICDIKDTNKRSHPKKKKKINI